MPDYKIRVVGHLPADIRDRFSLVRAVEIDQNSTLIYVKVSDQSALFGLLAWLRDMNLKLLSVQDIEWSIQQEQCGKAGRTEVSHAIRSSSRSNKAGRTEVGHAIRSSFRSNKEEENA